MLGLEYGEFLSSMSSVLVTRGLCPSCLTFYSGSEEGAGEFTAKWLHYDPNLLGDSSLAHGKT